jgi:hypothetical protein
MPELILGESYKIKFARTSCIQIFKLIEKHTTTLSHQILYTFTDLKNGIKVMFTNGVINSGNIIIDKYEEEKKDHIYISIPVMLPNQNKEFLESPIKLKRVNAYSNIDINNNRNAYLSSVLDDHDIYS